MLFPKDGIGKKNKKKKAFDGCTIRIRIDSAIKTGFNLLGISISQLISPAKLDSTVRFQFFIWLGAIKKIFDFSAVDYY